MKDKEIVKIVAPKNEISENTSSSSTLDEMRRPILRAVTCRRVCK